MAAARFREDADTGAVTAPARSDAYVGMLIISLAAMILGCVLLLIEFMSYDGDTHPPKVTDLSPTARPAPAGTPGAPVGGGGLPGPAVGTTPSRPTTPQGPR